MRYLSAVLIVGPEGQINPVNVGELELLTGWGYTDRCAKSFPLFVEQTG
jgi:hypothetical protein